MSHVRPAVPGDLHALAGLLAPLPLLARYGESHERLEKNLHSALERHDGLLVYDAAEHGPKGLAWYMATGTLGMGGYLKLLAVAPSAQGSGVGAALLAGYEAAVFAVSAHAFLLVSDFNTAAQRFYERHAYRRVGALPALVLPEVTELIYWKPRPPPAR